MKATKTVEYRQCDFCRSDSDSCFHKCLSCGKDVCYSCKDKVGVEYRRAVSVSGSGDGFYCHDCDEKDTSELHTAYQQMRSLTRESEGFYTDFRKRSEVAEKKVKQLRNEYDRQQKQKEQS